MPEPTRPASPTPKSPAVKVYIEGRYRKLARDLPQTYFYCPQCKGRGCDHCEGFGKLTRDSVQELIAWVAQPRFKARRNKFHGAGREDLDVRMLGEGRPFVLELLKAKRPDVDLEDFAAEVNRRNEGRLEIRDLRYANRRRVVEIKETRCPKDYRALIGVQAAAGESLPANEVLAARLEEWRSQGRLTVTQSTPRRVEHRRAALDRQRWIEVVDFVQESRGWRVTIRSQHGTYIKEVISGDGGRSRPSIADQLGAECTCLELDVMAILPPEPND